MILTGSEIFNQVKHSKINIQPFNKHQITTNSYDLRLGKKYIKYLTSPIDVKQKPEFVMRDLPEEGLLLNQGEFLLAETEEKIGSNHFVPLIHAKSGTARAGLFVHVTADLIDIGSFGKSTLQLYATLPIRVYPKMLIAQVTFWKPLGEIKLYEGKYQHADGPLPSKTYKDYAKNEY